MKVRNLEDGKKYHEINKIMFLFIVLGMNLNIIPLQLSHARQQLNTWIENEKDYNKLSSLKSSIPLFSNDLNNDSLGCVAIIDNKIIKSISLFEKDEFAKLSLKCVQSSDFSSGSLLVKAIANTVPDLNLSPQLHDRWKIAFMYYSIYKS